MSLQQSYYKVLILFSFLLASCARPASPPLWSGSKYTEADRIKATLRALEFINQSASKPGNFNDWASDYTYCFYSIAATSRDPELKAAAAKLAPIYAHKWAAMRATVPPDASLGEVCDRVFGWLSAALAGEDDRAIKPKLREAVARFKPVDFLLFDPKKEPPPDDVPAACPYDHHEDPRGTKVCSKCGRKLPMRTRYDVWLDAIITAYSGDRYGIELGGTLHDVLQWMPKMRPYPVRGQASNREYLDALYSLTHAVYALNDYGRYQLPHDLLPQELAYLKANLPQAIAMHDPETMGEFLDTLKAFGLDYSDEVIRTGVTYLLDTQRPDGTWSAATEKDAYTLYHSAWTAIDGLKNCCGYGTQLSFPELRPMLERIR